MQRAPFACIALSLLATACGATADLSPGPSAGWDAGPGSITVFADVPTAGSTAGAYYSLGASFISTPSTCKSTTVGACTVNPCYVPSSSGNGSAALPNAGAVSLVVQGRSLLSLSPQNDGSYASQDVVGVLPWQMGGETVTLEWAQFPGSVADPGGQFTLNSPPYVELTSGSAFAVPTSAVVRSQDLTFNWTSDNPPAAVDVLVVDLFSSSTEVYCVFNLGAGTGTVEAAALGGLAPGDGTYGLHARESGSEAITDGAGMRWVMDFNVDAEARTSYGLASGSVTFE